MKSKHVWAAVAVVLALVPVWVSGQVVINEILYHAPDELDDLQYVELHNAGPKSVDLSGWALAKGVKYQFPTGSRIEANGFLVLCQNAERFKEFYQVSAAGVFQSKLKHKGERIELHDAGGNTVDTVKFTDKAPWPVGADGHSGSLERISPGGAGDDSANWISSPLSVYRDKPSGTPGKPNAGYSATVPPVISSVKFSPELPAPDQPITVEAEVPLKETASTVNLRYRLAGPGYEKPEISVPMKSSSPGHFVGTIPGQKAEQLVRFRVEAVDGKGARRFFPAETEPRPALSAYVPSAVEAAKIPFGWIIHTSEKEMKAAENRANTPMFGGFQRRAPTPEEEARFRIERLIDEKLDFSRLWFQLAMATGTNDSQGFLTLRPVMLAKVAERKKLMASAFEPEGIVERADKLEPQVEALFDGLIADLKPRLSASQKAALETWLKQPTSQLEPIQQMISRYLDLEAMWYVVTVNAEPKSDRLPAMLRVLGELNAQRAEIVASGAGLKMGGNDRTRFEQVGRQVEDFRRRMGTAMKPHLSEEQTQQLEASSRMPREMVVGLREIPPGSGGPEGPGEPGRQGGPRGPRGPRGGGAGGPGGPGGQQASEPVPFTSAFVYFDPETRKTELFDFVQVSGRKGGQKVHLYRDHPLHDMTVIALIFEGDTASLVEPLAYEVYRRAGMPVEQSHFVRLWQDGKLNGYTLLIEQPNRAFLRRNRIDDGGNMYKLLWFGGDLIGQHEKHTNRRLGHEDLTNVVAGLDSHKGADQWDYIQKQFDVDEVATYFAVNMVLSHWDGFFNNYFTYHDSNGTGKWMMFPWDQDSTWGSRGSDDGGVFYNMALTFGMAGDTPPQDGGGSWRPPGWFSGPLLANPQFRKVFLARTKQLLQSVYTEAVFGPVLDQYEAALLPEVKLRAEAQKQDPAAAVEQLRTDIARCREHIRKRREFLLAQAELQSAAK